MTLEEYTKAAWERLPVPNNQSDIDWANHTLQQCYNEDFTLKDAIAYTRLTEHIDEGFAACRRMAAISAKYKKFGKNCTK